MSQPLPSGATRDNNGGKSLNKWKSNCWHVFDGNSVLVFAHLTILNHVL